MVWTGEIFDGLKKAGALWGTVLNVSPLNAVVDEANTKRMIKVKRILPAQDAPARILSFRLFWHSSKVDEHF